MAQDRDRNANPLHNIIHHEPPEVTKAKAYQFHTRNGSMEDFCTMYPGDRPPGREPRDSGRSR